MAVFAGDDVRDQHQAGVEDDQRLPRQGTGAHRAQLLEAVLGPGQMIAVDDLDAITRQQGGPSAVHRLDDRFQTFGGRADQCRSDPRFDAVDLAVDGAERGVEDLGVCLVGSMDGGPDAADDQAHQVDDRGEEELSCILMFRNVFEQLIDDSGVEGVLQDGLCHDGQRTSVSKALEDVTEDHHRHRLPGREVTPRWATA